MSGNMNTGWLKGFDEMHEALRHKITEEVMEYMAKSMDYIVRNLANYAKKYGDYTDDTGNLRSTIHGVVTTATRDLIKGEVRAPMEYAAAVEAHNYQVVSFVLTRRWEWIMKRLSSDFEKAIKKINSKTR